jgi:hypothetical protein
MRASGLASLAFFYCDFRDDEKKDRRGLLSSLLSQLSEQSDAYCKILSGFYSKHRDGSQDPSDSALTECLKAMAECPGQAPVYVVVDAIDECSNTSGTPSQREKVLSVLSMLVGLRLPSLRVCITSRPETDIEAILDPLTPRSFSLQDEKGQIQDIIDYITCLVNTDVPC